MVRSIRFLKYQALGNDYLFLDGVEFDLPNTDQIRQICHRNFGLGSDGILYGGKANGGGFFLEIINSDGSRAEISGNGTRIFARAMFDIGNVAIGENFAVKVAKNTVGCTVFSAESIGIDMGAPLFTDRHIPNFWDDHLLPLLLAANGTAYQCFPVSMGNPHCVIFVGELSREEVENVGKILETSPLFPEKTNVEFAKIIDDENIALEIWERGVGRTMACGSGACAAFAVSRRLGMCSDTVSVHMAGGCLNLTISDRGTIVQRGPVKRIATCSIDLADFTGRWKGIPNHDKKLDFGIHGALSPKI
jgi:diaminopimelate epimerase